LSLSPADIDRAVCVTIDVEWAAQEVLDDLVRALDERGVRATFFCTHPGSRVPGHERALHPNFRRNGDTIRALREKLGPSYLDVTDAAVYEHVLRTTLEFAPEARGTRSHSLFYESDLLPRYEALGLRYDSTYFSPMTQGLRPTERGFGVLELPVYFMDHHALLVRQRSFQLEDLRLDSPGLKVLDFHPNIVYTNATTLELYESMRAAYRDPGRLLELRQPGRGPRTLFLDVLDELARGAWPTATLGEVESVARSRSSP
jgi:hypothetical protein